MNKLNWKRKILIIIPVLILLAAVISVCLDSTAFTAPHLDEHDVPLQGSIASLEKIKLGGIKQSVLIRGENTDNPVLLFVHGGPGYSEMPLIRYYNNDLEKHFTVVTWDQRGTGKSFFWGMTAKSMTAEIILSDLHELVQLLKQRFGKEKIFIAGHSWGTVLALRSARQYSDDYYAYIGIGQIVNEQRSYQLTREFCLNQASAAGNSKAMKQLANIVLPDNSELIKIKDAYILFKWLHAFHGAFYREDNMSHLNNMFAVSDEYSPIDLIRHKIGTALSLLFMRDDLEQVNLFAEIDLVNVPVFFCMGRQDYQTPFPLACEYFDFLKAPLKKMIVFEESAHYPLFEEPDKFNSVVANDILQAVFE
ncbi:MAG: alpha/beta hydrolase [Spirochaetales bacterium]|nr:alpha/beta hydrolase [Spirochaetales bacterium]